MTAGGTWAVVPIQNFEHAKSRLAPVLGAAERAGLARGLFEHVLDVLSACTGLSGVLVATDSDEVARLAALRGARVIRDAEKLPLGRVVDDALDLLSRWGAEAALVVMGDLPELSTAEVRELLDQARPERVVLAPDRHARQTNALLSRLPAFAKTSFGEAASFELHRARIAASGLGVVIHRSSGFELDLDEPEDLARWRELKPDTKMLRFGSAV
jgi:2-phospho-L-lactate guanylyltransferase